MSGLREKIEENNTKKGIYLFEVYKTPDLPFNKWLKEFRIKFMGEDNYFRNLWTSNNTTKRYLKYEKKYNDETWIPLYIGESKNMYNRIHQHIFAPLGKPPFALKLQERNVSRENTLRGEVFRIRYVALPIKNYSVFAKYLEKKLRNEILPLAGR